MLLAKLKTRNQKSAENNRPLDCWFRPESAAFFSPPRLPQPQVKGAAAGKKCWIVASADLETERHQIQIRGLPPPTGCRPTTKFSPPPFGASSRQRPKKTDGFLLPSAPRSSSMSKKVKLHQLLSTTNSVFSSLLRTPDGNGQDGFLTVHSFLDLWRRRLICLLC